MGLMLGQPTIKVEIVELFAPQHAGQGLAMYAAFILVKTGGRDALVKLVSFGKTFGKNRIEGLERVGIWLRAEPQANHPAAACRDIQHIMRSCFGSRLHRIYCRCFPS